MFIIRLRQFIYPSVYVFGYRYSQRHLFQARAIHVVDPCHWPIRTCRPPPLQGFVVSMLASRFAFDPEKNFLCPTLKYYGSFFVVNELEKLVSRVSCCYSEQCLSHDGYETRSNHYKLEVLGTSSSGTTTVNNSIMTCQYARSFSAYPT